MSSLASSDRTSEDPIWMSRGYGAHSPSAPTLSLRLGTHYTVTDSSGAHAPAAFIGYTGKNNSHVVLSVNRNGTSIETTIPTNRLQVEGELITVLNPNGGSN